MLTEARKTKRSVLSERSPEESLLYHQISKMQEPWRSYACFTYLIGTRCREPLGIKKFTIKETRTFKQGPRAGVGTYNITKESEEDEWIVKPFLRGDISIDEDGFMKVKEIIVFKRFEGEDNTKRPFMDKFADPTEEWDSKFYEFLKEYMESKQPDEPLWTFTRQSAYYQIRKATGLFPHKLRSMRITKDVKTFGLTNIVELKKKHGMESAATPERYIELDQSDIKKKMRSRKTK